MRTERRREPRYPFIAMAEIVDEKEHARTSSRITYLSLHGCYVEMMNPFPQGTNVMIEICTETESLETHATVAFFESQQGMGHARVFRECLEQVAGTSQGKESQLIPTALFPRVRRSPGSNSGSIIFSDETC